MSKNFELAKKVFEAEAQAILSLRERNFDSFDQAVSLIMNCQGKLILTGMGKSGLIARKVASTFSSTGTAAIFLHPAESLHGDLGIIGSEDLVLAMSYGGNSPELNAIISYVSRKGIPLIAITGNSESFLSKKAAVVLDVKIQKEACPLGLAPTASSTATLAMGDALAMATLQSKGFSADEFAELHPGGALGFRLSRVKDLMHTGKAMPILTQDIEMRQVLATMSQGEVRGAAGVVNAQGELVGVITDGDIRRRLDGQGDPLSGKAKDLMSTTPRSIDANEIAEKALFMMEQFKINLLFVTDRDAQVVRKPVGILHIQDLLKAKIK